MMVWMCDRCQQVVNPGNRKNQRPDGWVTIRRQPSGRDQAHNWLLCQDCQPIFYAAMQRPTP